MNKKKIVLIALTMIAVIVAACFSLLFVPTVKAAGITRVQYARGIKGYDFYSSFTVTMGSTPTTGNTIIAVIAPRAGGVTNSNVTAISQTGVTWTKQIEEHSGHSYVGGVFVWLGVVGVSPSIAITISLTNGYYYNCIADVCEYSGLLTANYLDKNATNKSSSGTACSTGATATTTQADELWIGGISGINYGQTSPTNGFTLLNGTSSGGTGPVSCAYLEKIVSSTGTANSGTTLGGSAYWTGCIATFKGQTGEWTTVNDDPNLNDADAWTTDTWYRAEEGTTIFCDMTMSGGYAYTKLRSYTQVDYWDDAGFMQFITVPCILPQRISVDVEPYYEDVLNDAFFDILIDVFVNFSSPTGTYNNITYAELGIMQRVVTSPNIGSIDQGTYFTQMRSGGWATCIYRDYDIPFGKWTEKQYDWSNLMVSKLESVFGCDLSKGSAYRILFCVEGYAVSGGMGASWNYVNYEKYE